MTEDADCLASFQNVGKLFPGETTVKWITPDTMVEDALRVMLEHRYSQLPVREDGQLRGVFSLWSLAQQLATSPRLPVHELQVEDVMESIPIVTVKESLHAVLSLLEKHEARMMLT